MKINPLISVIMPLYNSEDFVRESIYSVLNQSYPNFELLVIDDCSSDRSAEIVKSIPDRRVFLYVIRERSGAAVARNLGLCKAKGDYVAFLDSDDLWDPKKLEKQLLFMQKNFFSFTCTYSRGVENGKLVYIEKCPDVVGQKDFLRCDYLSCLTVMAEKRLFDNVSVLPEIKKRNDYALWIQIAKKDDCHCLPEVLATYRIRHSSLSHQNKFSLLKAHYILWSRQFQKSAISAWCYALRNAFYTTFIKKKRFRYYVKTR